MDASGSKEPGWAAIWTAPVIQRTSVRTAVIRFFIGGLLVGVGLRCPAPRWARGRRHLAQTSVGFWAPGKGRQEERRLAGVDLAPLVPARCDVFRFLLRCPGSSRFSKGSNSSRQFFTDAMIPAIS